MPKLPQFFSRIFNLRNLLRGVFAIALLVTAWSAFCLEERWRGNRRWNEYREEAVARGTKLELSEVPSPALPAEQNFAAIPMIERLFRAHETGETQPKWFAALKLDVEGAPRSTSRFDTPDDLAAWSAYFVKSGVLPASDESPASQVLKALALVEPELAELREAGRRPASKFPVRWDKGFMAALPHLGSLQQSGTVYRLGMAAHLAQGDSEGAFVNLKEGLRLYTALRDEPALICGLVRISIISGLAGGIAEGIARGKWEEKELTMIGEVLATVDLCEDWRMAIQSERIGMNGIQETLFRKSDREFQEIIALADITGNRGPLVPIFLYPRGWLRLSQVKINQHFDAILSRIQIAEEGGAFSTESVEAEVLKLKQRGTIASLPYAFYIMATSSIGNVTKAYALGEARLRQVRMGCALAQHKLKQGTYPDDLASLSPAFLPTALEDPFDGAPMRYRKTAEGGFELWSIGANRIDDGAKHIPNKSWSQQPDLVLRGPGKP